MKVYEYLSETLAKNNIDFNEIKFISLIYLKVHSRFNHNTWKIVHKQLNMTDNIPINPMHIEEWDDDINNIYRVTVSDGEELIMSIGIRLRNEDIFYSLYCTADPINTLIIRMN